MPARIRIMSVLPWWLPWRTTTVPGQGRYLPPAYVCRTPSGALAAPHTVPRWAASLGASQEAQLLSGSEHLRRPDRDRVVQIARNEFYETRSYPRQAQPSIHTHADTVRASFQPIHPSTRPPVHPVLHKVRERRLTGLIWGRETILHGQSARTVLLVQVRAVAPCPALSWVPPLAFWSSVIPARPAQERPRLISKLLPSC